MFVVSIFQETVVTRDMKRTKIEKEGGERKRDKKFERNSAKEAWEPLESGCKNKKLAEIFRSNLKIEEMNYEEEGGRNCFLQFPRHILHLFRAPIHHLIHGTYIGW